MLAAPARAPVTDFESALGLMGWLSRAEGGAPDLASPQARRWRKETAGAGLSATPSQATPSGRVKGCPPKHAVNGSGNNQLALEP